MGREWEAGFLSEEFGGRDGIGRMVESCCGRTGQ